MGYFHQTFRPYSQGDRMLVIGENDYKGKIVIVEDIASPDAFDGEQATYLVRLEGEEELLPHLFGYWDLEPL